MSLSLLNIHVKTLKLYYYLENLGFERLTDLFQGCSEQMTVLEFESKYISIQSSVLNPVPFCLPSLESQLEKVRGLFASNL